MAVFGKSKKLRKPKFMSSFPLSNVGPVGTFFAFVGTSTVNFIAQFHCAYNYKFFSATGGTLTKSKSTIRVII